MYFLLTYLSKSRSLWLYLNIVKCNFNWLVIWHSCGWLTCSNILGYEKKQGYLFWTLGWQHSPLLVTPAICCLLFSSNCSSQKMTSRQETSLPTSRSEKCLCLHINQFAFSWSISMLCFGSGCFLEHFSWSVHPPRHFSKYPKTSLFVPEKGWRERRGRLGLLWKAKWNSESHVVNKTRAL